MRTNEQYIEYQRRLTNPIPLQEVEMAGTTVANAMYFSDANRKRILEIDYDHKEATEQDPDGEGAPRNLQTVAKAANADK